MNRKKKEVINSLTRIGKNRQEKVRIKGKLKVGHFFLLLSVFVNSLTVLKRGRVRTVCVQASEKF